MSCPVVFFGNETGNTLSITPFAGKAGMLTLADPIPNPGVGGPYLPNQAASFAVVGHQATYTYGTNVGGFISTILADVINAFNTDPTMSTLGTAASVGAGSLPDAGARNFSCTGTAVNIVLGIKGMKVYLV